MTAKKRNWDALGALALCAKMIREETPMSATGGLPADGTTWLATTDGERQAIRVDSRSTGGAEQPFVIT